MSTPSAIPRQASGTRYHAAGFSLIESLIAVMVFSFGALGIAGLQNVSMQSGYEAVQRTQAVYLANDIIERMRNNASELDAYDNGDDTHWQVVGGEVLRTPSQDCEANVCSTAELAAFDLWAWEQAIDGAAVTQAATGSVGGLANPTGCIRQSGNGRIEVAIAWLGRRELSNPGVASECTGDDDRYGDDDAFRRVLLVRTFIADLD